MGSSSLTRDGTQTPCVGSPESQPLDHQEAPPMSFPLSTMHLALTQQVSSVCRLIQRLTGSGSAMGRWGSWHGGDTQFLVVSRCGHGRGCWSEWGSCWGWGPSASRSGGTSSHRQTWAGPGELSGALMIRADVWILQWMADTVSAQTQPRNLWWGLCHTPHIFSLCPLCDLRPPFSSVCTRG